MGDPTHRVVGKRHRLASVDSPGEYSRAEVLEVGDECSPSAAELASFPDRFAPISEPTRDEVKDEVREKAVKKSAKTAKSAAKR